MSELLAKLQGKDRRSIGRANEVVQAVLRDPELLVELFEGLESSNAIIRMRTADVLEKVSVRHPDWLQPYRERLLDVGASSGQKEVQWHVAQIVGRLDFAKTKLPLVTGLLKSYLSESDSRIVKTCALEALANQAERQPHLRPEVCALVQEAIGGDIPSLAARARKLMQHSCDKWESQNIK